MSQQLKVILSVLVVAVALLCCGGGAFVFLAGKRVDERAAEQAALTDASSVILQRVAAGADGEAELAQLVTDDGAGFWQQVGATPGAQAAALYTFDGATFRVADEQGALTPETRTWAEGLAARHWPPGESDGGMSVQTAFTSSRTVRHQECHVGGQPCLVVVVWELEP